MHSIIKWALIWKRNFRLWALETETKHTWSWMFGKKKILSAGSINSVYWELLLFPLLILNVDSLWKINLFDVSELHTRTCIYELLSSLSLFASGKALFYFCRYYLRLRIHFSFQVILPGMCIVIELVKMNKQKTKHVECKELKKNLYKQMSYGLSLFTFQYSQIFIQFFFNKMLIFVM